MRNIRRFGFAASLTIAAVAVAAVTLGTARTAHADPESVVRQNVVAAETATDRPGPERQFALEYSPLSLAIGRISGTFEWAPKKHDVIVISPFFADGSGELDTYETPRVRIRTTGGGAELGYRYYTGSRGMNGLFFGPSFVYGVYGASLPGEHHTFTNAGVAFDAGAQIIVFNSITLGAGLGAQYTFATHTFDGLPFELASNVSGGLRPRFLASVGYAF